MANFTFFNLDEETRKLMLEEINSDISKDNLYLSNRLDINGKEKYPAFLIESVNNGTEETFTNLLLQDGCFNETDLKKFQIMHRVYYVKVNLIDFISERYVLEQLIKIKTK